MTTKVAQFISIAEINEIPNPEDLQHPLLTTAKFILADDKGNANNQGIKVEDFDEVIKSAIDMPVKMRYMGSKRGVGGHYGSIPIGHIKDAVKEVTADGRNILVGHAVLYKDEYPQEIDYLKETYANAQASKSDSPIPGISYEIKYSDSVLEDGVEWLKKMVFKAATIVRTPAYGSRTAILALASNQELSDQELVQELLDIVTPPSTDSVENNASAETFTPPSGVKSAAKRALEWISAGNAGANFTDVGRKRASDLARGASVSIETIRRMHSFFARHEVDKKAEGFNQGEKGFPSPGRVAWDAWGGDAGKRWADSIVSRMESASAENSNIENQGGLHMDPEEVKELEALAETRRQEIETLTARIREQEDSIKNLTEENSNFKKAALIEQRMRSYVEAGFQLEADAEKAAKKKDFLVNMTDEVFEQYLEDLKSIKDAIKPVNDKEAVAETKVSIPRPSISSDLSMDDLKSSLRKASRGEYTAE